MTEQTSNLNNDDFVLMKKINEDGKEIITGGGYKIQSSLLENNIAPMTTYNTLDQKGGRLSSSFDNLAVPAGLFYINTNKHKNTSNHDYKYDKHTIISDDLFDKLFNLAHNNKKKKQKTKKHIKHTNKNKTKKQL